MSLITWPRGESHFKADAPSRVDERIKEEALEAANERAWNAEIDRRDGKCCRACGRKSDPDVVGLTTRGHRAHIVYASASGSMEPSNRVTLCYRCHNDEHKNRLRFTEDGSTVGVDANAPMEFWRKGDDGTFFLSRYEVAVGRAEKD
jgi:hypothetical protein